MTFLKNAGREIFGLFVDDEFLALGALAVVGLSALVIHTATAGSLSPAATLFGGCLVVLVTGVLRTARSAVAADVRRKGRRVHHQDTKVTKGPS